MALSPKLDTLLFSTDANQIIRVQVNLERPSEVDQYQHMISSFHSNSIMGLAVCIKKQIIATCSNDRTVRIWSYGGSTNTFTLDIWRLMKEDCFSLALHPSGFHIVLGLSDRVAMMNILNDDLDEYKSISIKQCKEIQFSNGGQYFACQNSQNIQVYKFYTGETQNDFYFKGH